MQAWLFHDPKTYSKRRVAPFVWGEMFKLKCEHKAPNTTLKAREKKNAPKRQLKNTQMVITLICSQETITAKLWHHFFVAHFLSLYTLLLVLCIFPWVYSFISMLEPFLSVWHFRKLFYKLFVSYEEWSQAKNSMRFFSHFTYINTYEAHMPWNKISTNGNVDGTFLQIFDGKMFVAFSNHSDFSFRINVIWTHT